MAILIKVKDETGSRKTLHELNITFEEQEVTVKDIISARVKQEVDAFNQKKPEYYNGLVQPVDAEKTLNGFRIIKRKNLDAEEQVYVALDAFQKNGFFILIDNKQAESLEQRIEIKDSTVVSFVKLTPLVGG